MVKIMDRLSFKSQLKELNIIAKKSGITQKEVRNIFQKCCEHHRDDASVDKNKDINYNTHKFYKRKFINVTSVSILILLLAAVTYVNEDKAYWETECLLGTGEILSEVMRPLDTCQVCRQIKHVDVTTHISQEDFLKKYAYTNVPLVIKGAARNWTALRVFSYQYFKDLYDENPESYEAVQKNCQFFNYKTDFTDLQNLFQMPDARARQEHGEKAWYIGWCDQGTPTERQLMRHYERPVFLPDEDLFDTEWIFMGWPGEGAQMHIDMVTAPSWQAQISGTKTWFLQPSAECEDLCNLLNVTIESGDILTVDTNKWFHKTYIHPGNISISIGSEY